MQNGYLQKEKFELVEERMSLYDQIEAEIQKQLRVKTLNLGKEVRVSGQAIDNNDFKCKNRKGVAEEVSYCYESRQILYTVTLKNGDYHIFSEDCVKFKKEESNVVSLCHIIKRKQEEDLEHGMPLFLF